MMFDANPAARADMKAGTLYAVAGEGGWIYYGQVTREKRIGFLKRRDRAPVDPAEALRAPVMSEVLVVYPSIGRALREGKWKKLGRFPVHVDLLEPRDMIIWSGGTLTVSILDESGKTRDTRVEDPAIQGLEIVAGWDAVYHIPERLTADFGVEEAESHVGGPLWRERRVKEERARRSPDLPWEALPEDWVPTG